ncbi:cellulase family glycosylhydrolase [Dictyobacter kobayashii]|uniref:cellulase n=1 Tax=Dictyobacter kobayashii TaxID=2014872 RepID=A0A402AW96_9CHLR|nr:cellulase family glycosylhydrolase [Dictyobacter kobayashii]GCE23368.1 hypothetical protein KDK_71680 [Dictyobacter kobayashii]
MRKTLFRGTFLLLCTLLFSALPGLSNVAQAKSITPTSTVRDIFNLHVQGNQLVNAQGQSLRLLGVNRSGTEYKCINNAGIFDGPSDAASVDAIASWHVNAVRVPLNEDCWLGINGVQPAYGGINYQIAIVKYVLLLNSRGIIPILDLHWTAPGTTIAIGQKAMTDADHSVAFWKSVASIFKYDRSVIFDLFNEPYVSNWDCWTHGSTAPSTAPCSDVDFVVAGMQSLVDAVRSTGAQNVIMLSGIGYANWVGGWLDAMPADPQHNLMASAHIYNFSGCKDPTCYDQIIGPVAAKVPVVFGELGENDCQHGFVDTAMNWADQNGVGYLGWAWDTYDCSSFPSLISDYNGTPTAFGVGFKDHLQAENQ